MIYVCIPSHNEATTIGLVLWKVRQVFQDFPREYQLLVLDDGSTDQSAEVLDSYAKTLPLTIVRHGSRQGYAASVEELLRLALERTDRPKRDCAVLMHADFGHGPEFLPEFVKRIEGGADLVVGQAAPAGSAPRGVRWLRRASRWLIGGSRVPGIRDPVSGMVAFRLVSLRNALRAHPGRLLATDDWPSRAELLARSAPHARRIEVVEMVERPERHVRSSRLSPWDTAKQLWRARRTLRALPGRAPRAGAPEPQPAETTV